MSRPFSVPVTSGESSQFVLEDNRKDPPEERVTFLLRALTGAEQHEVTRLLSRAFKGENKDGDGEYDGAAAYDGMVKACEHGLTGWENFTDREGKDITFPRTARRAIQMLPPDAAQQLGREVLDLSKLSGDDEKN